VHRDIKPENLLLDILPDGSSIVKIIDWGCAAPLNQQQLLGKTGLKRKLSKLCGTPLYMAPEVITNDYDEKCDIWSAGVVLYILLSGIPPYYGRNDQQIMDNILKKEVDFGDEAWSFVSPDAIDLISRMMAKEPEARLSAMEALNHPWFQK
jgi:calcium-dependent protein kinase